MQKTDSASPDLSSNLNDNSGHNSGDNTSHNSGPVISTESNHNSNSDTNTHLHADINWHHFDCIDSTNAYLIRNPQLNNTLISATHQTAGRGRRKQQWADEHDSLLFSLATEFPIGHNIKHNLSAWAIQVAITLAETLAALTTQQLRIKWPNDLYTSVSTHTGTNKCMGKCSGILVESSIGTTGRMVTGIGINLAPIQEPITADYPIAHINTTATKEMLLIAITNALYNEWHNFISSGTVCPEKYKKFDALKNQTLIASDIHEYNANNTTQEIIGIGQGINEQGHLLIMQEGRLTALTSQQRIRIL